MNVRRPYLTLLLLLSATGGATAQQTVTLRNGDRLTGMLRGIDGGTWTFRYAGEDVNIAADQVVGFTAPSPIGVRLADGTIATATIATAGQQLQVTLTPGGTRTVPATQLAAVGNPANLATLRPVAIGFLSPIARFWAANLSFGFSDKSGNSRARGIGGTVDLTRRTAKDRLKFGFGFAREESEAAANGELETTVSKYYGTARLDVFFIPRVFVFVSTRQERDRFQDIALRSTYNLGLGFDAVSTDRTDLSFSFAGGARREDFISAALGAETNSVVSIGSSLRHDLGPAQLAWTVDFSPKTADLGDFRLVSDASFTAPIFFGIGFRFGILNEHSSRPPAGVEKNDVLLTTNVSYTIGN